MAEKLKWQDLEAAAQMAFSYPGMVLPTSKIGLSTSINAIELILHGFSSSSPQVILDSIKVTISTNHHS